LALGVSLSLVWPNVVPRVGLLPQPSARDWYDGCNWHHRYYQREGPFWQPVEDSTARACSGRVAGTVRMKGGPAPGIDTVVAGEVVATDGRGRSWRAEATTDGFTLELPVGSYRLTATSPAVGDVACRTDSPVVVESDLTTGADVVCPIR
jgi:hypothetical protein